MTTAYSPEDVHRSLRRWCTLALDDVTDPGAEWVVELVRREVADQERPVAVVENAGPMIPKRAQRQSIGRLVGHGGMDRDLVQPWTLTAYPITEGSARDCALRAERIAAKLFDAVSLGMTVDGAPLRIALYEYEGLGFTEADPEDPYDYLWVDDFSGRAIPDSFDDRRFTVVLTLRLSWRAPGRAMPPTPDAVGGMAGSWLPHRP